MIKLKPIVEEVNANTNPSITLQDAPRKLTKEEIELLKDINKYNL